MRNLDPSIHQVMLCCAWSLSRVQLFVTAWTIARQAPLSRGFSRQDYWSGLPRPPPGDLPNPGIKSRSPKLQMDSLPAELPGKPQHPPYIHLTINSSVYVQAERRYCRSRPPNKANIAIKSVTWIFFFPGAYNSCNAGDLGSIPGLGRSPEQGNGSPLQYSCLENPMNRGAWQATVHGVARATFSD